MGAPFAADPAARIGRGRPASAQAEEPRARPVCAGNRMRDLAERRIAFPGEFKALLRDSDRVQSAAPFSHQPHSRPDTVIDLASEATVHLQILGQALELSQSRLTRSTIGKLLHAIRDRSDQQISAQPRRLASVEPSPLLTKPLGRQISQLSDLVHQFGLSLWSRCRLGACSLAREIEIAQMRDLVLQVALWCGHDGQAARRDDFVATGRASGETIR
jgi:hypothetical protein